MRCFVTASISVIVDGWRPEGREWSAIDVDDILSSIDHF